MEISLMTAQDLGLHKETIYSILAPRMVRQCRLLWWCIYSRATILCLELAHCDARSIPESGIAVPTLEDFDFEFDQKVMSELSQSVFIQSSVLQRQLAEISIVRIELSRHIHHGLAASHNLSKIAASDSDRLNSATDADATSKRPVDRMAEHYGYVLDAWWRDMAQSSRFRLCWQSTEPTQQLLAFHQSIVAIMYFSMSMTIASVRLSGSRLSTFEQQQSKLKIEMNTSTILDIVERLDQAGLSTCLPPLSLGLLQHALTVLADSQGPSIEWSNWSRPLRFLRICVTLILGRKPVECGSEHHRAPIHTSLSQCPSARGHCRGCCSDSQQRAGFEVDEAIQESVSSWLLSSRPTPSTRPCNEFDIDTTILPAFLSRSEPLYGSMDSESRVDSEYASPMEPPPRWEVEQPGLIMGHEKPNTGDIKDKVSTTSAVIGAYIMPMDIGASGESDDDLSIFELL